MELYTRCPRCSLGFKVSVEQLQRRRGYTRCPQCAHIFDGFEAIEEGDQAALQDQPSPVLPEPADVMPDARPAASPVEPVALGQRAHTSHVDLQAPVAGPQIYEHSRLSPPRAPRTDEQELQALPKIGAAVVPPSSARLDEPMRISQPPLVIRGRGQPEFTVSYQDAPLDAHTEPNWSVGEDTQAAVWQQTGQEPEPFAADDELDNHEPLTSQAGEPDFHISGSGPVAHLADHDLPQDATENWVIPANDSLRREPVYAGEESAWRRWRRRLLLVLCLLGLLLAGIQLIYVYRVQIASHVPFSRTVLEYACAQWGCQVPYERRLQDIQIAASAFKNVPEGKGKSTLDFTLRNQFRRAQQWPAVTLELKDFSGALLLRRNVLPEAYLTAERRSGPFPAQSELAVQLPVNVGDLKVNGYQLALYFP